MPAMIEPYACLFKRGFPYALYLLCQNFELMVSGRWQKARGNGEKYLMLRRKARFFLKPQADVVLCDGIIHFMLALISAFDLRDDCLNHLNQLKGMDFQLYETGANCGRILFHRLRGEEETARALERETKLQIAQHGSMWPLETQLTWHSVLAYVAIKDLAALERVIRELEPLAADGVEVSAFTQMAKGYVHWLKGNAETARDTFRELLRGDFCRSNPLMEQIALCGLARSLLSLGDKREALTVARLAASLGRNAQTALVPIRLFTVCVLAQALSELGDAESALALIDRYLALTSKNPLIDGSLHEAGTLVALAAKDLNSAKRHLARTKYWFSRSRNPALIARYQSLESLLQKAENSASQGPWSASEPHAPKSTRHLGRKRMRAANSSRAMQGGRDHKILYKKIPLVEHTISERKVNNIAHTPSVLPLPAKASASGNGSLD
jgi:tetratricopeptide (TPR) repeat protein